MAAAVLLNQRSAMQSPSQCQRFREERLREGMNMYIEDEVISDDEVTIMEHYDGSSYSTPAIERGGGCFSIWRRQQHHWSASVRMRTETNKSEKMLCMLVQYQEQQNK